MVSNSVNTRRHIMKLLLITQSYPPENGIAGRRIEGWVKHLPQHGIETFVLTRFYDPEDRNSQDYSTGLHPPRTLREPWVQEGNVVYTGFHPSWLRHLPRSGKLGALAHFAVPEPSLVGWNRNCREYFESMKFRPDLIIATSGPACNFRIAKEFSRRLGVPWVADYRDLWILPDTNDRFYRLKCWFQQRHLKSVRAIMATTHGMVDILKEQVQPLSVPMAPVLNGAEPRSLEYFSPEDSAAVEDILQLKKSNQILLLSTGFFYDAQCTERFLDCIAALNRNGGLRISVAVVGNHDSRNFAKWSNVRVFGPVSYPTCRYLQQQATAAFYPTKSASDCTFAGKLFEQIVSGPPVLVAFTPSSDLMSFCRLFDHVAVCESEEAVKEALQRIGTDGLQAKPDQLGMATKVHWAGELARFLRTLA